jgi:hypothetical protein
VVYIYLWDTPVLLLKKAQKTNKLEKGAYMFAVHVKPAAEIGVHYAALVNALKEHDRNLSRNHRLRFPS